MKKILGLAIVVVFAVESIISQNVVHQTSSASGSINQWCWTRRKRSD
jgi:hypothetical protein